MSLFSQPLTRRKKQIIYLSLIIVWAFIWLSDDYSERKNNLFSTEEIITWLIPTALLIYQAAYNKLSIWIGMFTIGFLYSLLCFILATSELIHFKEYWLTDLLILIASMLTPTILYLAKPTENKVRLNL